MNYRAFFQDVIAWMDQSNQMIKQYTIFNDQYWNWALQSSGELCNKYGNHELVKQQMIMLLGYLDQQYKKASKNKY